MYRMVSNSAGLSAALRNAKAGDEIVLENSGSPYHIEFRDRSFGSGDGLLIRSADPDDPAVISTLLIRDSTNITVENVAFDSSEVRGDRPDWLRDIYVAGGKNIAIRDSTMTGTATEHLRRDNPQAEAESFAIIRDSVGVDFENNVVSRYNFGLQIFESRKVNVVGNEFTALQGDTIRLAGVVDTLLEGNYIHDILGSDSNVTHLDMIQLWSTNTKLRTENLTIRGNVLDAGNGAGSQSIFLRNEQVDMAGGGNTSRYYKNIVITDNVIYNGHLHGITVGETDRVQIRDNTLVTNATAVVEQGNQLVVYDPRINVAGLSKNVDITNNVTASVRAPDTARVSGNFSVDYVDTRAKNFVDKVFVNIGADGVVGLQARPGGPLDGKAAGAAITQFDSRPDELTAIFTVEPLAAGESGVRFDASLTAGRSGLIGDNGTYTWVFADGVTLTGRIVTRTFTDFGSQSVTLQVKTANGEISRIEADFMPDDPLLLDISAQSGAVVDNSSYASTLRYQSKNVSDGVVVKNGEALVVGRDNDQIYQLGQFTLSFDFRRTTADAEIGKLASIHRSFSLELFNSGELGFKIETSGGVSRSVTTSGAGLTDADWHRIALVFDGDGGSTKIYVDGSVVGQVSVNGSTKTLESWGLEFGSQVSRGVSGAFDSIRLQASPLPAAEVQSDYRAFVNERAGLSVSNPAFASAPDPADDAAIHAVIDGQSAAVGSQSANGDVHLADLDFENGDSVYLDGFPAGFFQGEDDPTQPEGSTFLVNSTESLVRLLGQSGVSVGPTGDGGAAIDFTLGSDDGPNLRIDTISSRPSWDLLRAVDTGRVAIGGFGDDVLLGLRDDDVFAAGAGDDVLYARRGDDWLLGGAGDDRLTGGDGSDLLEGGDGADKFIFEARNLGAADTDRITDLNFAEGDILVLSHFGEGTFAGDFESLGVYSGDKSSAVVRGVDALQELAQLSEFSLARLSDGQLELSVTTDHGAGYSLVFSS